MELELHQLERRYEQLRLFDRGHLARLSASLLEHGQRSPVLVVAMESRFVLIDGYRRVRALEQIGRDLVRSTVLELQESEALLLSPQLLSNRRTLSRRHGCSASWSSGTV